jgi:outer membrane protein assembly factor BamA
MKATALFLLGAVFSSLCPAISLAQNPPTGQIQRSQEILGKEEALQDKLQEKVFIREVQVEGVTLIPEKRIKDTIAPFENTWLGKKDISQIAELIRQLYIEEGRSELALSISHEVRGRVLKIRIKELQEIKPQNNLTKTSF